LDFFLNINYTDTALGAMCRMTLLHSITGTPLILHRQHVYQHQLSVYCICQCQLGQVNFNKPEA